MRKYMLRLLVVRVLLHIMDLATGNLVKKNCYHINSDLGTYYLWTLRTYGETEKL